MGGTQDRPASIPATKMPAELVAAARMASEDDVPVRLQLAGARVVAIVCGEGDPRQWWTADLAARPA